VVPGAMPEARSANLRAEYPTRLRCRRTPRDSFVVLWPGRYSAVATDWHNDTSITPKQWCWLPCHRRAARSCWQGGQHDCAAGCGRFLLYAAGSWCPAARAALADHLRSTDLNDDSRVYDQILNKNATPS